MNINVVCTKGITNMRAIETSIKTINAIQRHFNLTMPKEIQCGSQNYMIKAERCSKCITDMANETNTICITNKPLSDNWFSHEYREYCIISTFDWESKFAPPSIKAYLIYQIAQALIHFTADLSEEIALRIVHNNPQGCILDMCENKLDIKLGMVAGSLCPQCKGSLLRFGITNEAITAIEELLEFVRSEAIGKPKLIDPNRAFIVMRFSKNDENDNAFKYGIEAALKDLGIDCVRADTELRSSQLLDKIKNNIERSRFVIAKVDIENLNVYFELGFAMGQNKDVILVTEDSLILNLPSDLKNWECITYERGNYSSLKNKLVDYLKQNYHYA
jgi:hypothetical protein